MTNHEGSYRMLEFARDFALRNMRAARRAGVPAGVVPAAQEVVELTLKAAIRKLGADCPKVRDPAPGFVAVALAAQVPLTPDEARRLMIESRRLAEQRGPAFYQEADVSDDDAARACRGRRVGVGANRGTHLPGLSPDAEGVTAFLPRGCNRPGEVTVQGGSGWTWSWSWTWT